MEKQNSTLLFYGININCIDLFNKQEALIELIPSKK